ncbi:MAG: hypothetical protein DELT_00098 [Desulfovibrio sp.]
MQPPGPSCSKRLIHRDFLLFCAALAVGVAVFYATSGWDLSVHGRRLVGAFAAIVVVWSSGCMTLPVSCLLLLVLMTFSATDFSGTGEHGGVPMASALKQSLGGFATLVPITILAGTAFAAVLRSAGFAERIVYLIMKLVAGRSGGATPARVLAAFFIAELPASIMIPSAAGRTAMYLAIVNGFEKPLGFTRADDGPIANPFQKALWIGVSFICLIMGGAFLTGASLTLMVGGIIEQGTGIAQFWASSFAVLYLPAIAVMFITWFSLLRLFPSTIKRVDSSFINDELKRLGPLSFEEKYCMATFIFMVGLFLTDSIHRIPPPMVLVITCFALFVPGIGPGNWKEDGKHISWDGFFVISVALGFSHMLDAYGVMRFIADQVARFSITSYLTALLVMIAVTTVVRLGIASNTASAALLVPIAIAVGKGAGLSIPETACVAWVTYVFCRLALFLPHQSLEIVMSYGMNGYTKGDLFRAAAVITPLAILIYLAWSLTVMPGIVTFFA